MGSRPPASASRTELIRRLDAEWRVLAGSRLMRTRLRSWAVDDHRLSFDDGDRLLSAAQSRNVTSWAKRDEVLSAVLERAIHDSVACRVALQVVLPGLKSLINGIRCWDVEERAARVVATALDVILWCATEPAGTPPSFRIYTNTRRRVLRSVVRERSEPVVFVEDYSHHESGDSELDSKPRAQQINDLVEWVGHHGQVREDAARLVVVTRVAGVTVDELASFQGVDPQTLRQRRLRTERRVRQSLEVSR